MSLNITPIAVTYSNAELRILVEEFIFQQKKEFTFKSLCSFVLYWAMEDGKIAGNSSAVRESNQLEVGDSERLSDILESIVKDGRICKMAGDDTRYLKL